LPVLVLVMIGSDRAGGLPDGRSLKMQAFWALGHDSWSLMGPLFGILRLHYGEPHPPPLG
jgi:hypothetical protein